MYKKLFTFLDAHKRSLSKSSTNSPVRFLVARQCVWSMIQYLLEQRAGGHNDMKSVYLYRDSAMAVNIDFLRKIYPGKKMILWAHNSHLCHNHQNTDEKNNFKTMGYWLWRKHKKDLYIFGQYMYAGQGSYSKNKYYDISDPDPAGLESILHGTGYESFYLDLSKTDGANWDRQKIPTNYWGTTKVHLIPKDQYDGLLFFETVHPADYLE